MAKMNDGIVTMASNLGKKSELRRFAPTSRLSDRTLLDMFEQNWIVQKYVETLAEDMTKRDRKITTPMEAEETLALKLASTRLNVFAHRKEVLEWASLLGDAMVVAITSYNDGDTPENYLASPLDLDKESIDRFIVLDKTAYDVSKANLVTDINSPSFNMPESYDIKLGNHTVHHTRVCRIKVGKQAYLSRLSRGRYGSSDIQSVKGAIFSYLAVIANISDIVEESKSDVLSVEGFMRGIMAGREDDYEELARAMLSIRSSTGFILKDTTSTWEQKELTFTGLVDILKAFRDDLAGGFEMPLTRLFGQSASGFASGEEDNTNYYERIAARQEARLRPLDEFFDKFLLNEIGSEHSRLDFNYPSIRVVSDTEQSTILATTVTALSTALTDGVINEVQYAQELKNRELISSISDADIEKLEEIISEPTTTDNPPTENAGGETEQTGGNILPQANNSTSSTSTEASS
jgi:uncharacterized protein